MWIGDPPPPAAGFIARPDLEAQVRGALVPGATVTLVGGAAVADGAALVGGGRAGAGGIGRGRGRGETQLALAVASAVDADLRIWVTATSRASVLSVYAEAAAVLGVAPDGVPAFLRETARSWTIIFDDITGGSHLDGILPSGPSGRVLLTGSGAVRVPGSRVLTVGGFTRRESMAYLMTRLTGDPGQRQGAADLIADLGDEPLALVQASAVIASSELTCREYREHFRREGPQPGFAAETTWTLALEHADLLAPGTAQPLLALAALLDRHGIPRGVFGGTGAGGTGAGGAAAAGAAAAGAAATLEAVGQAGLVSIDGPLVRMASPVQAAIRAAMPDGMLKEAASQAADALVRVWPGGEGTGRPSDTGGVRPAESVARALRSCAESLRVAAGDLLWEGGCHELLLHTGRNLDDAGLSDPAVSWWSVLAETAHRVLGTAHPDTALIRERLNAAQLAAGQFTDAIAAFTAAVTEAERSHGPASLEALAAREELAAAHHTMGGYEDAIALYRGALTDRERVQGIRHPDCLTTGQKLAEVHLADGRPKVAISLLKRVLSDRERFLGKDHLDTIAARAGLGTAYHVAGRMASAVQLYERARDGYASALGPDDRLTLSACLRLAHGYYGVGRLGDTAKLLRDTLARCEATLPASDPLTGAVRESLANVS
jgi:tetratricopeptide (TPR) repeat protein